MTTDTEALERELESDLNTLAERFADEGFSTELYRALTNNKLHKKGGPEGHVSLSWSRAEALVNDLRERRSESALTLAQTGGEGEVSNTVRQELERLGWTVAPLDTSHHDDSHLDEPESAPSPGGGETAGSPEWERRAHEEADENQRQSG